MMKTEIDPTLSKRPLRIPEQKDLQKFQEFRTKLENDIRQLEKLEEAHRTPYFHELIIESYTEMRSIEMRMAQMPLEDTSANLIERATLQGRWRERLELTSILVKDQNTRRIKESRLRRVIDKIMEMAELIRKKGKTT